MGIKIRSMRDLKKEMIAVVRGEQVAPQNANHPSFESIEAVTRLLTRENRQLLAIIEEKHPTSVAELARLVGRQEPNVSRTLSKFESLGFVRLLPGQGRAKRPELLVRHLTVDIDLCRMADRVAVA